MYDTGEIPKEQMLNIAGSATIGVLVCVSIVLVCATLLILGMTVVWKHHIKLRSVFIISHSHFLYSQIKEI